MSAINPQLFRSYSIRGDADRDLTDEVVARIGQAVGVFFRERGGQRLVVGRDGRLSSARISQRLIAGLLQAGLQVVDVGAVPTPVHNFATDWYGADGGAMVTASHNPPEQNGLKLRGQLTLSEAELQEIYHLACAVPSPAQTSYTPDGRLERADVIPTYLEMLAAEVRFPRQLKVVVDGGHGMNGPLVSQLLRQAGCEVVELFCQVDGRFPGRDPDPTAPGALDALSAAVRRAGADLGLAYDGDGDRLAVVDEQGQRIWGDYVLMLLARQVLAHGPASIVYEVLCSQALTDDILAHGGRPIRTPCGYAFVHQAVLDNQAPLGGELSGHLFFNRRHFRFDDAILASVEWLNLVALDGEPLSARLAQLPRYYASPPMRLPCADHVKRQVVEQVKQHFAADWPVDELDGVRVDFGDGWALVRASNTQPALSLRFEARTPDRLEPLMRRVLEQVQHWIAAYGG